MCTTCVFKIFMFPTCRHSIVGFSTDVRSKPCLYPAQLKPDFFFIGQISNCKMLIFTLYKSFCSIMSAHVYLKFSYSYVQVQHCWYLYWCKVNSSFLLPAHLKQDSFFSFCIQTNTKLKLLILIYVANL